KQQEDTAPSLMQQGHDVFGKRTRIPRRIRPRQLLRQIQQRIVFKVERRIQCEGFRFLTQAQACAEMAEVTAYAERSGSKDPRGRVGLQRLAEVVGYIQRRQMKGKA